MIPEKHVLLLRANDLLSRQYSSTTYGTVYTTFQVEALGSSQAAALHSLANCLYPSVPQYRLAWP